MTGGSGPRGQRGPHQQISAFRAGAPGVRLVPGTKTFESMLSEVECRPQQDAALRAVRGDEREPVALPPGGVEFCKLAENGHRTLLLSGAPYEFADAHDQAVDALAEFRSGVCGPHFRAGCRRFACQVRSLFRRHALHPYNAALAAAPRA